MINDYYLHEFVHYSYANIINSLPLYINSKVFPFESWTISTYQKAIQEYDQENIVSPKLPVFVIDPTLQFELDETSKQHWRFPEVFGDSTKGLFQPVIKTDKLSITPHFITVNIRYDMICWFESVYQKLDFDTSILLAFGGIDRYTIPYQILYDLPYPNALQDSTYIDLSQFGVAKKIIKTLGKELYVFPIVTKPLIKITSISDQSDKYGADNIATWRSIISLEMKVHVLTGLNVISDWKLEDLELKINVDSPNVNILRYIAHGQNVNDIPDDEFGNIMYGKIFEIPPDSTHLVFESDKVYSNTEYFEINLNAYTFDIISPFIPDPTENEYVYDDVNKVLKVKGPLYKGQHIHLYLK